MEFGVSPIPETRRAMIDRGKLFGVPCYRWIPAKSAVDSRILGGLRRQSYFLGKLFARYAMICLNSASLAVAPALDISATMSSHSFFVCAWAAKTSAA